MAEGEAHLRIADMDDRVRARDKKLKEKEREEKERDARERERERETETERETEQIERERDRGGGTEKERDRSNEGSDKIGLMSKGWSDTTWNRTNLDETGNTEFKEGGGGDNNNNNKNNKNNGSSSSKKNDFDNDSLVGTIATLSLPPSLTLSLTHSLTHPERQRALHMRPLTHPVWPQRAQNDLSTHRSRPHRNRWFAGRRFTQGYPCSPDSTTSKNIPHSQSLRTQSLC